MTRSERLGLKAADFIQRTVRNVSAEAHIDLMVLMAAVEAAYPRIAKDAEARGFMHRCLVLLVKGGYLVESEFTVSWSKVKMTRYTRTDTYVPYVRLVTVPTTI